MSRKVHISFLKGTLKKITFKEDREKDLFLRTEYLNFVRR